MKITLSEKEVLEIIKNHLDASGMSVEKLGVATSEGREYEYYGDPTRENRREVKVKNFVGVEAEVQVKSF